MRSHGLRQLVDDKSVASSQQTCSKLIIKTFSQACCNLFEQVVTSLLVISCNKPDFKQSCWHLMKLASLLQLIEKLQPQEARKAAAHAVIIICIIYYIIHIHIMMTACAATYWATVASTSW